MAKRIKIFGALMACVLLTACNGSGNGSGNGSSGGGPSPNTVTPPAGTGNSAPTGAQPPVRTSTSTQTTLLLVPAGTHSLGIYVRNPWTGVLVGRGYVPTGMGPVAVATAATPQGQYVYVANNTAGTLSAYSWDETTNSLVSITSSPVPVGGAPTTLAVVGSYLYVASNSSTTISAFAIGANGVLAQTTVPSPDLTYPTVALLSGPSNMLYQLNTYGIATYSASGTDGSLTQVGTEISAPEIIAGSVNAGDLYIVTSTGTLSAYTLASLSAQPTSVSLPSGLTPTGVTATQGTVAVSGVNPTSGMAEVSYYALPLSASTLVPVPLTTAGNTAGITASPGGHYVFVTNPARGDLLAYTVPTAQIPTATLSAILRTRLTPGTPLSLSVTVSLAPQSLYVVNQGASAIAAYPSATDGSLGAPVITNTCVTCSTEANQGPSAAVLAPTGQFLYATDWAEAGQGDVTTFGIEGDGTLGIPVSTPAGMSPMGVAVDPSNRYLYVANSCFLNGGGNCPGTIDGYTIQNGALTAMSSGPTSVSGDYPMLIAIDPTGRFLFSSEFIGGQIDAFTIDPDNGALTLINGPNGPFWTGTNPWTIVIGPSGRHLYVTDNGNVNLPTNGTVSTFTIDEATGALSPSGDLRTSLKPLGLVMGPQGRRLYVATQSGVVDVFIRPHPISAPTIWAPTAAQNPFPPIQIAGTFPNAYGLAISANGQALYVIDNCTGPNYTNGTVQALAIPAFSATSASAYPVLGTYQTNTCSVQAVSAGGLN